MIKGIACLLIGVAFITFVIWSVLKEWKEHKQRGISNSLNIIMFILGELITSGFLLIPFLIGLVSIVAGISMTILR